MKKLKLRLEVSFASSPEREICFDDLVQRIVDWLNNTGDCPYFGYLGPDFLRSLFEIDKVGVIEDHRNGEPKLTPGIHIRSDGERWVRITIDGYKSVFAFRPGPSRISNLKIIPVPEQYEVDYQGNIMGRDIIFTQDDKYYPWMIIYPGRYDVIGRLNYLLRSSGSNILTTRFWKHYLNEGIDDRHLTDQLKELRELAIQNVAGSKQIK